MNSELLRCRRSLQNRGCSLSHARDSQIFAHRLDAVSGVSISLKPDTNFDTSADEYGRMTTNTTRAERLKISTVAHRREYPRMAESPVPNTRVGYWSPLHLIESKPRHGAG